MKVLFVCSGNSINGISTIVKNQGESLKNNGATVSYFCIVGKGLGGYLRSIPSISKEIQSGDFDIVHAHYSLSGFASALAGARPLVVSLMGSDVKAKRYWIYIIRLASWLFWTSTIVKSQDMKKATGIRKALVIANGVDITRFYPRGREESLAYTKWDSSKRHILFAANKERTVKNFTLAKRAFELIDIPNVELHSLSNIKNELIPFYMGAADAILLTSHWEGSPNVIKESMACNRPIVSTDVGDINHLLNGLDGCYVTSFNEKKIMQKILLALEFTETQGINRIKQLELDSNSTAQKLIAHYLTLKKIS